MSFVCHLDLDENPVPNPSSQALVTVTAVLGQQPLALSLFARPNGWEISCPDIRLTARGADLEHLLANLSESLYLRLTPTYHPGVALRCRREVLSDFSAVCLAKERMLQAYQISWLALVQ